MQKITKTDISSTFKKDTIYFIWAGWDKNKYVWTQAMIFIREYLSNEVYQLFEEVSKKQATPRPFYPPKENVIDNIFALDKYKLWNIIIEVGKLEPVDWIVNLWLNLFNVKFIQLCVKLWFTTFDIRKEMTYILNKEKKVVGLVCPIKY